MVANSWDGFGLLGAPSEYVLDTGSAFRHRWPEIKDQYFSNTDIDWSIVHIEVLIFTGQWFS